VALTVALPIICFMAPVSIQAVIHAVISATARGCQRNGAAFTSSFPEPDRDGKNLAAGIRKATGLPTSIDPGGITARFS